MAAPSQKKELKDFFQALTDCEDASLKYVTKEAGEPASSGSFLDPLSLDSIKAEVMAVRSGNGSIAESSTVNVIFKFDAIQRDLAIRKKRRTTYYSEAALEYDYEAARLNAASNNSLQTYSGNTKLQRG